MAQAPIARPPAFNVDNWTSANGKWTCPTIAVSDRAGLVEILRLCGPERFDEAYAFLAPEDSFFEYDSLDAVLGPHTQQFQRDDRERLDQVWARASWLADVHIETNILLVIEKSVSLWKDRDICQQIVNARHYRVTVIIVEDSIYKITPVIRKNIDVFVARPVLTEPERRKTYDEFFRGPYDRLALFTAAHAHEAAQGARIVWKNAGQYDDIAHSVRSLVVVEAAGVGRAPFTLIPRHQMRVLNDMSADERRDHMAFVRLDRDVALTEAQTVELFCASRRDLHCFATSRHMPAIQTYLAWIADVRTELLTITDTSCGHMPRVLCDLIVEYL